MLVLTLGIGLKDQAFYVRDTRVELADQISSLRFKLRVHQPAIIQEFWITDRNSIEIIPGVRCSAGHKANPGQVKVAIEANPQIPIKRESLWNQDAKE